MRGVFFFLLYGCVADCIIPTGNQFAPLPPHPHQKKENSKTKILQLDNRSQLICSLLSIMRLQNCFEDGGGG